MEQLFYRFWHSVPKLTLSVSRLHSAKIRDMRDEKYPLNITIEQLVQHFSLGVAVKKVSRAYFILSRYFERG